MRLELKNIGCLKEANVKLDGLTVIAGENDTGKSTIGKALMAVHLAHHRTLFNSSNFHQDRNNAFLWMIDVIFKNSMYSYNTNNSKIALLDSKEQTIYEVTMANNAVNYNHNSIGANGQRVCNDFIFLQTPFVWDLMDFFKSINYAQSQSSIFNQNTNIQYPFFMFEIYGLLIQPRPLSPKNLKFIELIKTIINGEFKDNHIGHFFSRQNSQGYEEAYPLINVASGIKYFGIIQKLLNNGRLNGDFVVIDEPENHLHPKWQLEFAKLIVELAKFNKIIVASHSPYMIEALQRYSDTEGIKEKTNFYLAKDGVIKDKDSLGDIFELLSEPFDTFKEMDRQILKNE